jgi:cytochrome c-type biogenesis protein CcmH/NrfF
VRRVTLLAALALTLACATAPAGASAVRQRTSMSAVLPYVMCVTCKIPLADAQSPQADQERALIQQLIYRGDTLAEVKRTLVAQYGDEVLALPPANGFDLTVYVVPIAVVAALLALIAALLPRWRRRARSQPASDAGPELSAQDAARLDAELERSR